MLGTLRRNSIDLTITSPPYDNLRSYHALPFEKFQKVARQLWRVTAFGGVVVWIVSDATIEGSKSGTSFRQALYFRECGFNIHDVMIWNKGSCAYQHAVRYIGAYEYMFVLSRGAPKTVNLICDRQNRWGGTSIHGTDRGADHKTTTKAGVRACRSVREYGARLNIWEVAPERRTPVRRLHPAVFPEALVRDHCLTWSNPGDVIMDPFLGSGTTGKVVKELNRNFIGIEKDLDYFAAAQDRIGWARWQDGIALQKIRGLLKEEF